MAVEQKFPSEVIDLPSRGKVYSKDNPLSTGKVEIKYMTAREEDILTSQNLIQKGIVIDKLLESLIITDEVSIDDLILGDKNAIMVAARILAYGPEYLVEVTLPDNGDKIEHIFNLADCPFKYISDDVKGNSFEITLPVSKSKIKFKLLNGHDEKKIDKEIESLQKLNSLVSPELTTRLKHTIVEVDGSDEKGKIYDFVDNMLSRDSFYLRQQLAKVSPDIELTQDLEIGGKTVSVDIPLTVDFFWPSAQR